MVEQSLGQAKKPLKLLTLYFDVWNKEIVGYGLSTRKGDVRTYYDGLNQKDKSPYKGS